MKDAFTNLLLFAMVVISGRIVYEMVDWYLDILKRNRDD